VPPTALKMQIYGEVILNRWEKYNFCDFSMIWRR